LCASWCEAGHCREGEGRLSFFDYDEIYGYVVAVCLKFPSAARFVLQSHDKKFYNTGTQRLNQRWLKCVENEETFVIK
jgi:hypothetical protein